MDELKEFMAKLLESQQTLAAVLNGIKDAVGTLQKSLDEKAKPAEPAAPVVPPEDEEDDDEMEPKTAAEVVAIKTQLAALDGRIAGVESEIKKVDEAIGLVVKALEAKAA